MFELLVLGAILAAAWFWQDSTRSKEEARRLEILHEKRAQENLDSKQEMYRSLHQTINTALNSPHPDRQTLIKLRNQLEQLEYKEWLPMPLLELSPSREVEYWTIPLDIPGGELDRLRQEVMSQSGHFVPQ